jgi:AcrR family transcriptional regulator
MGTASTSGASARERRSDAVRNRELLIQAATAALHREGLGVPMTTIAADAGVGIGTLYRHFPTREQLLDSLTRRSFDQVLSNAMAADRDDTAPAECLRHFIEAAISQRNELVLPLHGGPPPTSPATKATRARVHLVLQHILDRGRADGTIRSDVTPQDIVVFGALLAQPRPPDPAWDARCGRLLTTYLRGLGCGADEAIGRRCGP